MIIFHMLSKYKIHLHITFLVVTISASGCGVWGNFTTYFNRYYNTVQLFDEVQQSIQKSRTDLFATTEPNIAYADKQKLDAVVEKCSKILQFSPDSKYVDDVLLILGKTFFYQQNYLRSSRELEELLNTQDESDLRLEAAFWLAKCQLMLNKSEDGIKTLKSVIEQAKQEEENDILQLALIEEIKYYIYQAQIDNAIKSSEEFISITDENERSEKIEYELGQLYEEKDDYANATRIYQNLVDSSPSFDMEFNANLALAKAYRNNGQVEKSLELLDDMSSEDKNKNSLDQISLEKGISLFKVDKYTDATDVFIFVDTTYKNSMYSGVAKYELGRIFENIYNNLDTAGYYYSRAILTQLPEEYYKVAQSKASKFTKYKNIKTELNFNLNQLGYALNPEKYIMDSTEYYDKRKELEVKITNLRNQQSDDKNRFISPGTDTPQNQLVELGKPPVKPIVSADSIKKKIANNEFDLGNFYLTEINRLDSAYFYYMDIINNYPESNQIPNTLFALGNYYVSVGDSLKADSLFNVIYIKYKDNKLVNSVANILNKPSIDFEFDPANNFYVDAERELKQNNYYSSVNKLFNIYNKYPTSVSAPKALYTSGWIYENKLMKLDSAATIYDTLINRYPGSKYAKDIAPKVLEYHKEMGLREKAISDSIKAFAEQKNKKDNTDSLNTNNELTLEQKKILEDNRKLPPALRSDLDENGVRNKRLLIDSLENNRSVLPEKENIFKNKKTIKDTLREPVRYP
ncbi:MAG TPA: tetratricopeptide repeat protein [Ignavibacteriaceae bacterium]|nr:tetratricopeptide repeat protein [Ignavibacteriaceae bacterium]